MLFHSLSTPWGQVFNGFQLHTFSRASQQGEDAVKVARVCREGAVRGHVPLKLQVINTKTMEELGYEVGALDSRVIFHFRSRFACV